PEDRFGEHSWHLYRIEIDPETAKMNRDEFCAKLKERNIGTSLHFIPIFEHPYYKRTFNYKKEHYPNASAMYSRALSLPLFAGMNDEDTEDVVREVRDLLS
ncbi:MAG TPA: DegT/DnrJ/EryC1/StrS family aminotransferase, partial [Leptospiraceae bacterium]|nr:DegT/DnrJ/EryC1/StrS family aminotransferase [Leptospiraceae bacterium]